MQQLPEKASLVETAFGHKHTRANWWEMDQGNFKYLQNYIRLNSDALEYGQALSSLCPIQIEASLRVRRSKSDP